MQFPHTIESSLASIRLTEFGTLGGQLMSQQWQQMSFNKPYITL
jgi:hypothetical protein